MFSSPCLSGIMGIAHQLISTAYTLYLFTKSDTPLVIFPMVGSVQTHLSFPQLHHLQVTVGMVLAGPTDWPSFIMALIWLELHLLAFDASARNS